ncbi:hypothetical protein TW95_gp1780 [Pandoravirus inopinatum]|uniref:Uncharacterized protein n=1 Tax=Pandoravirus inopinatum TaxID=1605721 RepID=A0A0B5J4E6_9VIRU|nr:hypothetical protein TW95_gp1780 [Pandoravirus inopinatum]AJF98514.1 hypothetical protein [Pandoravirus inopinatum]
MRRSSWASEPPLAWNRWPRSVSAVAQRALGSRPSSCSILYSTTHTSGSVAGLVVVAIFFFSLRSCDLIFPPFLQPFFLSSWVGLLFFCRAAWLPRASSVLP